MARRLSLGKIMNRFLAGWDRGQISFDLGTERRKAGTLAGLRRKAAGS